MKSGNTHANGQVYGIIDWSTAQINDISQDFSGLFTVFG
jgi:macrolide phosphotransferase